MLLRADPAVCGRVGVQAVSGTPTVLFGTALFCMAFCVPPPLKYLVTGAILVVCCDKCSAGFVSNRTAQDAVDSHWMETWKCQPILLLSSQRQDGSPSVVGGVTLLPHVLLYDFYGLFLAPN